MQRTFGRSKRGTRSKGWVANHCGVNITIVGAIVAEGVVNLSMWKPHAATGSKKRKLQNSSNGRSVQKQHVTAKDCRR
ncbi:hypothetical protein INT45_011951 [Circinella minor]|uniref:Uncharacterized protein n=1 Tax=Circinella minor TaxID=1195481 RepID=A0A8H7SGD0_9FUNG|nr:hypothetical protein INT45_011951 [Circinella minor]